MHKCDNPNCAGHEFPEEIVFAVNHLLSAVFMTVLTIDRQQDREQEIIALTQPTILEWMQDHFDDLVNGDTNKVMSDLAIFAKDTVEKAIGYAA